MAKPVSIHFTRRRFLAASSAAVLASLLPLPRGVMAGERTLLITDNPMTCTRHGALLLVNGDRLARLHQMREGLKSQRPDVVQHELDSTDQVLLNVALADLGTGVRQQGDRLYLHYSGDVTARRTS